MRAAGIGDGGHARRGGHRQHGLGHELVAVDIHAAGRRGGAGAVAENAERWRAGGALDEFVGIGGHAGRGGEPVQLGVVQGGDGVPHAAVRVAGGGRQPVVGEAQMAIGAGQPLGDEGDGRERFELRRIFQRGERRGHAVRHRPAVDGITAGGAVRDAGGQGIGLPTQHELALAIRANGPLRHGQIAGDIRGNGAFSNALAQRRGRAAAAEQIDGGDPITTALSRVEAGRARAVRRLGERRKAVGIVGDEERATVAGVEGEIVHGGVREQFGDGHRGVVDGLHHGGMGIDPGGELGRAGVEGETAGIFQPHAINAEAEHMLLQAAQRIGRGPAQLDGEIAGGFQIRHLHDAAGRHERDRLAGDERDAAQNAPRRAAHPFTDFEDHRPRSGWQYPGPRAAQGHAEGGMLGREELHGAEGVGALQGAAEDGGHFYRQGFGVEGGEIGGEAVGIRGAGPGFAAEEVAQVAIQFGVVGTESGGARGKQCEGGNVGGGADDGLAGEGAGGRGLQIHGEGLALERGRAGGLPHDVGPVAAVGADDARAGGDHGGLEVRFRGRGVNATAGQQEHEVEEQEGGEGTQTGTAIGAG